METTHKMLLALLVRRHPCQQQGLSATRQLSSHLLLVAYQPINTQSPLRAN